MSVDQRIGEAAIDARAAGWAFALPVALFLLVLWALHAREPARDHSGRLGSAGPLAALLVLATPFTPEPVLLTGVILTLLLATKLGARRLQRAPEPHPAA